MCSHEFLLVTIGAERFMIPKHFDFNGGIVWPLCHGMDLWTIFDWLSYLSHGAARIKEREKANVVCRSFKRLYFDDGL